MKNMLIEKICELPKEAFVFFYDYMREAYGKFITSLGSSPKSS